jgi:Predicted metal-binding integral membrane protein
MRRPGVLVAIAGAWLIAVTAQATGNAALLHHHVLIEGGAPLWLTLPLFLLAWQVMIGAMMLPASLPTIGVFDLAARSVVRPRLALTAFLAAYATVWTAFGLFAFMGDVVLHHIVDLTPWLAARPWLIESGVLALAGAYQLLPPKRRFLTVCRHPRHPQSITAQGAPDGFRYGLEHAYACIGSSWALMLVMFAAGFANLGWMTVLTVIMVYEVTGRYGRTVASAFGLLLLGWSALLVFVGWVG